MFRFGFALYVWVRQSRCVLIRLVKVTNGRARQSRHVLFMKGTVLSARARSGMAVGERLVLSC